jgi:hypothetical protein
MLCPHHCERTCSKDVTSAFSDSDLPFIAARICIGGAAGALALSPRPALLLTFTCCTQFHK